MYMLFRLQVIPYFLKFHHGFHLLLEDATSLHPPAFSEAALSLMQEVAEKVNRVMHAGYVKARCGW